MRHSNYDLKASSVINWLQRRMILRDNFTDSEIFSMCGQECGLIEILTGIQSKRIQYTQEETKTHTRSEM